MSVGDGHRVGSGFRRVVGSVHARELRANRSFIDFGDVWRRWLPAFCVVAGGLALWSAPAQAAGVRSEIGAFGPGGPGVGVFSDPQSIAVEKSSGDVFVYDVGEDEAGEEGNIYKFNAAGEPVDFSSTSTNVIEGVGGEAHEVQIAVNSSGGPNEGDIYVATGSKVLIYSSSGAKLSTLTERQSPCGVAVNPVSGAIYVAFHGPEEIKQYTPVTSPVSEADYTSTLYEVGEVCNIAVDFAGDVYAAGYEGAGGVKKYEASQFNALETPAIGTTVDSEGATLAVNPTSGDVYIDEQSDIAEYESSGMLVGSFGSLSESYGVAERRASGDVYASDGEASEVAIFGFGPGAALPPEVNVGAVSEPHSTSVTLNGTVNPQQASVTACEFEYGANTSYGHREPCSKAVPFSGDNPEAVSAHADELQLDTTYYFRLSATNANGTESEAGSFTTPGPRIAEESVANVTSSTAELQAQIDPHGVATSYYFQYGPTTRYGASIPAPPGAEIGAGESDQSALEQAQGLTPDSTYHYRVVAVQGAEEVPGPDQTFTTQPPASGFTLPDGRVWEMVSPPNKHGAAIDMGTTQPQASEDGDGIVYRTKGPITAEPAGNRYPEPSTAISSRDQAGVWSTLDITPPNEHANGITSAEDYYPLFSSDLSLGIFDQYGQSADNEPALSDEASERTIYLRHEATCETAPEACYTPLVTGKQGFANVPAGIAFGNKIEFLSATPDLSHAVLDSEGGVALTTAQAGRETNLYEWAEGQLQLVSVLPGGAETTPASVPVLGNRFNFRHTISDDGSRVFWTNEENPEHLYMRDTTTKKTLQIDAPEEGVEEQGEEAEVEYQTASSNGSRVFFTDTAKLTKDSTLPSDPEPSAPQGADLYECEVVERAGKPACDLSDLTVDPDYGENGETAAVQGAVIGAGESGSDFYFVANGALAEGAAPGNCIHAVSGSSVAGRTCNLYVERYNSEPGREGWQAPTFIATLSNQDIGDWGGGSTAKVELQGLTAGVSSDGQYLAFMSERPLTGYDNTDVNSDQPDEEVFLYDASTGHLVCASCDPTGARPLGGAQLPGWTYGNDERSYDQPRYLSDSGRLFFDSSDALVPQDVNGKQDVYEYEPPGVGSCETASQTFSSSSEGCVGLISSGTSSETSTFLEASASGGDVFFATYAQLVPQDVDDSLDIYDASVCSQSSPCSAAAPASPPPCDTADSCEPAPTPQPQIFGPSGSATFSGAGNLATVIAPAVTPKTLTRAQKLAKALKVCKKKAKSKRKGCEAAARKKYGAKKRAKAKKSKAKAKKSNWRGN